MAAAPASAAPGGATVSATALLLKQPRITRSGAVKATASGWTDSDDCFHVAGADPRGGDALQLTMAVARIRRHGIAALRTNLALLKGSALVGVMSTNSNCWKLRRIRVKVVLLTDWET